MWNLYRTVALLGVLTAVGDSRAQFLVIPPPFGGPPAYTINNGFAFALGRHRWAGYYAASSTTTFYGPYAYGPPPANNITIININNPPPQIPDGPTFEEWLMLRDLGLIPRKGEPREAPADKPPAVIRPGGRDRAPMPPPEDKPPQPKEPPIVPLPFGERREANPAAEHARLVKLGKEAFAEGHFARAAERFRQAVAAQDQAAAYFLLAQAEVALGKYFEAFDAINAGLLLDPDWPMSPFRPQRLYPREGNYFTDHLQRLQSSLTRHPDDPVLLFLYAYQLWFDGRRNEALPLFQRAAAVLPDKSAVELFLRAKP
jgi:tetratricopeptide (TPR) repeat protein